jgi:hypothetical protein
MSRLFFSYSRADADFVRRLAGDLRAAGIDLWLDQEDIPPGERWDRAVEEAMKSAPSLLVVLSPVSASSQNVLDEMSYGLETGKRIIPVLHKQCEIPFRLRRLQYVDFTGSYDRALAQLVKAIRGREQPAPAASVPAGAAAVPDASAGNAPIGIPAVEASPAVTHPTVPADAPLEARQSDRAAVIEPAAASIAVREDPSRRGQAYAIAAALIVIVALVLYVSLKDRSPSATGGQAPAPDAVAQTAPAAANPAPPVPTATPLDPGVRKRYTTAPCGSIHDARTNLEWFVGPDRNTTWHEAERWTAALSACGGGWQMPTVRQLQALYDDQSTAGTGHLTGGRRFPARMDPAFAAIGGGSWVWARDAIGESGRTFNFNQGVAVAIRRDNTILAIRAFAVRVRPAATGAPAS